MTEQDFDWYGPDAATFGDRVSGARQAVGMTQEDLAARLGIKLKTLQGWENDLSEPRANRLSMLSGVLNVSISWLLTGEGEGLDAPDVAVSPDPEMTDILAEMREMKAQMLRTAERIGRLEKRLRSAAPGQPV
ncbi:helix-turn-helix domain-containing protein [Pseudaestuariivita atlantica]|uniref:XRE family transcriptional regulator n=1 Tax=Pseudaestuariivita atlantica TaxID=1317121 RepID=A0A0L1JTI0_9RHOB|nr:helix-turn-helix transcriptional regulator [Pseudaestuariivita atlantica]KNG95079.1 XRE family transcriptional regulator [Pseudaestuariivita atlantica]